MLILILILVVIGCGFYQFVKATKRAEEILDGSQKMEQPDWKERLALAVLPTVQKDRDSKKVKKTSYIDYGRDAVNDRLEEVFRRYRSEEISLDDYRDLVEREANSLRDRMEDARASKRGLPRSSDLRDFYDDEIEEARDSLDETRWRLDWIEDRQEQNRYEHDYVRSLTPEERGEESEPEFDGSWAKFDYTTEYGTESTRDLINWVDKGFKIVGYDRLVKGTRTFNKARMENVRSSSPIPPAAGMPAPIKSYGSPLKGPISEPLTFRYCGQNGVESDQELRNWYEYEKHVSGWCMRNAKGRGFSKKKVIKWLGTSESQLL